MKRTLSILIAAILLMALPAVAERDFSTFDYKTGQAGSSWLLYNFPDIDLFLPLDWEGRIKVEQSQQGVSFYQTASYEKYAEKGLPGGGFLFELSASADEGFRDELPAYSYLGYSENAGLHFFLILPSDYPAFMEDEAIRAEYDEMSAAIDGIVEKVRIAPSLSFYTEGLESTDAGMS